MEGSHMPEFVLPKQGNRLSKAQHSQAGRSAERQKKSALSRSVRLDTLLPGVSAIAPERHDASQFRCTEIVDDLNMVRCPNPAMRGNGLDGQRSAKCTEHAQGLLRQLIVRRSDHGSDT
jgi:hypothetical protein